MKTCALFVLLTAVSTTTYAGEPPTVGDYIDIPPSEYDIEQAKGGRQCLDDACEEYVDISDSVPIPRTGRISQILRGHFIDLSVEHTVIYGVIYDEVQTDKYEQIQVPSDERFMQFENGPVSTNYDIADDEITTCQHSKTKITYLVDRRHSGGTVDGDYGHVYFIGVNVKTHEMEVVYSEYAEHGPYDNKICSWSAKQEKLSVFSDSMAALRIEEDKIWPDGIDEKSIYYPIGEMESGDTMQLPSRSIPAKTTQVWLEKLFNLSADIVFINGEIHPALAEIDYEHTDDWHIIQITGTEICGGEYGQGVVLVKHASQKDWRAIYNVQAGCTKKINYPLYWRQEDEVITVEDDKLSVTMYYEFTHWGEMRDVVIDLHKNVITAR